MGVFRTRWDYSKILLGFRQIDLRALDHNDQKSICIVRSDSPLKIAGLSHLSQRIAGNGVTGQGNRARGSSLPPDHATFVDSGSDAISPLKSPVSSSDLGLRCSTSEWSTPPACCRPFFDHQQAQP